LRIAVIADLHGGSAFIDLEKVDRIVELTNAARPDLILLAGDYLGGNDIGSRKITIERISYLLHDLSAPLGVYAILGNHDHTQGSAHIAAVLAAAHIVVLQNGLRAIPTPRGELYLVGIDDPVTGHADPSRALSALPPGRSALCFMHGPDPFPDLPRACLLTIAGHTHGGQVDLPLIGRLIVPSRFGQRYAAGLIDENGHYLFVSTGIGTTYLPVRFRVPPEISILDVR
jgi:predicted MPP superfamily phosphohydrolase